MISLYHCGVHVTSHGDSLEDTVGGSKDIFAYITFTLECKQVIFHFAHVTF